MNNYKPHLIAGAVLILLAGVYFAYQSVNYRTEISEFDLKASAVDAAGISPRSHFILKTTAPLTTAVLEKYVKVQPATEFDVKKVAEAVNTYEIIPKEELTPNKIYTIAVDKGPLADREFSWAYQVKAPFAITSSVPADKGTSVPVNSGIELNFNRDTILNPETSIEISPAVAGTFQVNGNKVVFVPKKTFAERTLYTVKVKSGTKSKGSDDALAEDKTIQFETGIDWSTNTRSYAEFSRLFSEFKTGSNVAIGLRADGVATVNAKVYKLASAQEFIDSVAKAKGSTSWAQYSAPKDADLPEDKRVFTGDLPVEKYDYSSIIRMPEKLPSGYYQILITAGKDRHVSWFQVNPAASFAALASVKSLVWLKDIAGEKNIAGVPILFKGTQVGTTGADGVALFDTPSELVRKDNDYSYSGENNFFVAAIPGLALVVPVENEYGYSSKLSPNEKWWSYISLNKPVYLPTDTVRFFAVGKPRTGDSASGDEVSVKLTNSYWAETRDIVTYAETKVKISDAHAMTGEMSFVNLKPGTYTLTFYHGDQVISTQLVTVSSYIKPAYKITLSPDKTSVFAGDTVSYKVKAEFFEGTPVANMELSYSAYSNWGANYSGKLKLDALGEGSFVITPKYENGMSSYWPLMLSVNVSPTKSEEGQIEVNSSVFVFGPHVSNSITQTETGQGVVFSVKTRAVVLSGSLRGTPYWDSEEYLGGPVAGANTRVDVTELNYIQTQTGTHYDPINKLTYPVYTYSTDEHPISSQSMTSDQNGVSQVAFSALSKKVYKFVFTTDDGSGRTVTETRYFYGGSDLKGYYEQEAQYYSLKNEDSSKSYKVGDPIRLKLQTYEGFVPPEGRAKFIFMTVNNGTIEYRVQDTPKYEATFRSKDIPNIGIWPGWFDKGRFHNSYLENISFDADTRRLNISVTMDKLSYKPGDTANLSVKVRDANGNPVRAEVNLSALDEAVFSVRPEETDIVQDLYRDIYSELVIRTSNMPPYGGGGAEKGGGGDGMPRTNIKEMALYKTVSTDGNGMAKVEFKLPDNITSWRLTSQALTKDLYAGKSVSFIPVTLPFFIDSTLNNTYLAGDELILRLRTFGTAATGNSVGYSVESPTLGFGKIEKIGGNSVEIPLGTLAVGNHDLTLRARTSESSDAVTRNLAVKSSYFTKQTSEFYEGKAGLRIAHDAIGYTTLTFSSYGRGRLYNELKSLSYESGQRIDQTGARLVATELLNSYFAEKNELPEFDATRYQSSSGGARLLPYSSDEIELSAISAHLFGDSTFDRSSLVRYLTNSLTDKDADASRSARALYGLAAFGEPVLIKIQSLKDERTLTLTDKVFVALALDSIGAKEEARAYYIASIKPAVVMKPSYAYVGGLSSDETITTTALVAALTSSLEEPESAKLAVYAEENSPKETLSNFERLLYIQSALPKLEATDVRFSYDTGKERGSKTLKNGESFELTLSQSELGTLKLSDISGALGVVASYEKQSTPASIVKDFDLGLTRLYEVNGKMTREFNEGDLVTVRLSPKFYTSALPGAYQIVDYLPSGLRPVETETGRYYSSYDSRVYPTEVNDQKVTFIIDKSNTLPVYYFARVITKGMYKAEPALMQSLRSLDSATLSNEDSIIVK